MKNLILLALTLLLMCGCINKGGHITTSTEAGISTSTTELLSSSTSTTSDTITTTLMSVTTSTTLGIPEKCSGYESQTEKDQCVMLEAVNTGDRRLCEFIEKSITRNLCLKGTEVETDGRSTVIQGYIVNKTSGRNVQGVVVIAYSKSSGELVEEAVSDRNGFYKMRVPSRDTYLVKVSAAGKEFIEEKYALKGWTYEIWFTIP